MPQQHCCSHARSLHRLMVQFLQQQLFSVSHCWLHNVQAAGSPLPPVHTHSTLLTPPSHSNAGFIFLGTCLRLLALQSPGLREQMVQVPQWPDILQQPATVAREGAQLSVPALMQLAAGVVIDSAPSRLTPDIAARWGRV